jgi:hypothetical protein
VRTPARDRSTEPARDQKKSRRGDVRRRETLCHWELTACEILATFGLRSSLLLTPKVNLPADPNAACASYAKYGA